MTASWLFLGAALWGAWFTWNGYRPIYRHGRLSVVSFFAGWLTTELALHHIAWQLLFAAGFIAAGALAAWPGWLALGISLVSWAGLGPHLVAGARGGGGRRTGRSRTASGPTIARASCP